MMIVSLFLHGRLGSPPDDWVLFRLGVVFGSVGHKVKIHKITPVTVKERGDIEIKDYVVLQKTQGQDSSDGTPDPDGTLKETVRIKIHHYRNIYFNRPVLRKTVFKIIEISRMYFDTSLKTSRRDQSD